MNEPKGKEQSHNGRTPLEPTEKSTQIQYRPTPRQHQIKYLPKTPLHPYFSDHAGTEISDGDNSQELFVDTSESHTGQVITREKKKPGSNSPFGDHSKAKEQGTHRDDGLLPEWQPPYLKRRGYTQVDSPYSHNSPYSQTTTHRPSFTKSQRRESTNEFTVASGTQGHLGVMAGDDWEILDNRSQSTSLTPSLPFPGTWTTALHETTSALTSVSRASVTYASAISQSGIGRAGWSIGSALVSSTNKKALRAANWAVNTTGVTMNELPRPVRGWLEKGERMKRIKSVRRVFVERMDERMEDERGAFVLETTELVARGEIDEGEPREEAMDEEMGEDPAVEDSDDELL